MGFLSTIKRYLGISEQKKSIYANKHSWCSELGKLIEKANSDAAKLDIDDWFPMTCSKQFDTEGLWEIINYGESLGIIRPGQRVLDLGSGSGSSSITWAYRGYNVICIELHKQLVNCSKNIVKQAQYLIESGIEIKVYHGSYYPKEYIEKRKNKESTALDIEQKIISTNILKKKSTYLKRFHPMCKKDIYKKHNIDLHDIDIFYAYLWEIQAPSVLEMFKQYARDDAILCIFSTMQPIFLKSLDLDMNKWFVTKSRDKPEKLVVNK